MKLRKNPPFVNKNFSPHFFFKQGESQRLFLRAGKHTLSPSERSRFCKEERSYTPPWFLTKHSSRRNVFSPRREKTTLRGLSKSLRAPLLSRGEKFSPFFGGPFIKWETPQNSRAPFNRGVKKTPFFSPPGFLRGTFFLYPPHCAPIGPL